MKTLSEVTDQGKATQRSIDSLRVGNEGGEVTMDASPLETPSSDFAKFIAAMSELAFIRGYVRGALQEKHLDARTLQLLTTIERKATEGLVASGVELASTGAANA